MMTPQEMLDLYSKMGASVRDFLDEVNVGKVVPRTFNELPTPALNYDGEIVRVGCALHYSCNGEWQMISSLGSAAACVDNLEELSDYEAYKEEFFANELANNFINSFDNNESSNTETETFEVCLSVSPKGFGHTALIDETGYRFGLFAEPQTVNITATPNNNKSFLRWEGAGAVFGDSASQQTTLLVDKDLFITGYFEADTNEDPGGGGEGSFGGESIIVKDSFTTNAAPLSGGVEFYSTLANATVKQGHSYDERRIDKYGASYGLGYDTSRYSTSNRTIPFRSLTIHDEVSPSHNLSQFHDSGTIKVDAIRFRCKRGRRGAGYFGIARLFFVKGTERYNIYSPHVRDWYYGMDTSKHNMSVSDLVSGWLNYTGDGDGALFQKYVFGYFNLRSTPWPNNATIGSPFISGKLFTCEDSEAETCLRQDITKPNSLYENVVENDPLGTASSKTPDTNWTTFNAIAGDEVRQYSSSFPGVIWTWTNSDKYSYGAWGISGGIDFPAEVYFTVFFKTPMDFTDLMCMSYNVVCDQQEAEVTFEFRIAN